MVQMVLILFYSGTYFLGSGHRKIYRENSCHYIETSQFIWNKNQLNGFYTMVIFYPCIPSSSVNGITENRKT